MGAYLLFLPMNRLFSIFFSFILLVFLWCSVSSTFASGTVLPEDNPTSANFQVKVRDFHPLGNNGDTGELPGTGGIMVILENIADILLMMIPLLGAISIIIAGYFMIFSRGVSEHISTGKNIIKWNLLAIVIAFLSFAIIRLIASFFSGI